MEKILIMKYKNLMSQKTIHLLLLRIHKYPRTFHKYICYSLWLIHVESWAYNKIWSLHVNQFDSQDFPCNTRSC